MDAFTEIRRQAVQRVLARRRPVTEKIVRGIGPGGWTDMTLRSVDGSEFLPPADLAEWLDDQLVSQPWTGPFTAVLWSAAEAARVSTAAAAAEIAAAKRLSPWDQFHAWRSLRRWLDAASLPEARSLMRVLLAEWGRLRLADERPAEPELPELPDQPQPAGLRYPTRWGTPAGVLAGRA